MSAHSPGPWRYERSGESNYMLIFCSNDEYWNSALWGYGGEADARLIAAAPDLLEALTTLLSYTLACEGLNTCEPARQIAIAQTAIAKATGKLEGGRNE